MPEMSKAVSQRKSLQGASDTQRRGSLLEKIRLTQQRKSLTSASLKGKAFLSYHELAPALMAMANKKRSSICPSIFPALTREAKKPSIQQALRNSLQTRRLFKRISQEITADVEAPRMSSASKDWELKLINGLLSDHEFQEPTDSEEWRRFTLAGFSDNDMLKLDLAEPEAIPLPPSPQPLEVQKISAKPYLRVVQAIQASEETLDEFDYPSGSDISEDEASDSDPWSFEGSDISPISIKRNPEIRLQPESWPFPSNGVPTILSPTTPLPDPLRCSPPEHKIVKSRSQQSLRSVRSNRCNRKAFVMQQNESSVSVHSLGMTTTKNMSDIESALDLYGW